MLVQPRNILGLDRKVVGKDCERPLLFRCIANPPEFKWVFLALEPYVLVKQNNAIQEIISSHDFILETLLRSDDEYKADTLNLVQSGKIVIFFFKDIRRIRLIIYLIHCLHIVKFRFCNMNVCGNLSDYIKQCMYIDSDLGLSEVSPLEKLMQRSIVVESNAIELSIEFKRSCDSLALSKVNQADKLFKDLVIPVSISVKHIVQLYVYATATEMIALTIDGFYDRCDFPEAVTTCRLFEHHDKKLISIDKMIFPFVSFLSFYNAVKDSFMKKTDELTEYVFADYIFGSKYGKSIQINTQLFSTYLITYK